MESGIEKIRQVEAELNRIIRGKSEVIHNLLIAFVSGGNILLDDVPGVGKTTLAKALARLVDARFSRIQFTPDLLPADIIGTNIYNPREGSFQFRPGPVFTNILLADEINRASPRTQSALLECMCEHQVSIGGVSRELEAPFMVIATQNPIEFQGTYPLPEAQLDRFAMRLSLGYPSEEAEAEMLADRRGGDPATRLTPVISGEEILELRHRAAAIGMESSVSSYLLELVRATRGGTASGARSVAARGAGAGRNRPDRGSAGGAGLRAAGRGARPRPGRSAAPAGAGVAQPLFRSDHGGDC